MNGTERCRRCMFMRVYLMVAGALVTSMFLQPEWAARVARMVPPPEEIAWIIAVAIPALFFIKLLMQSSGRNDA